jgi:phosphate transport system permease protein
MTTPMRPLDVRPRGEPLVWLTAMGLSLALTMVAFLFVIIVANGATVFWPKRIQEWTLTGGERVLGELVETRRRKDGSGAEEMQVFLGNKDANGIAFRFVDLAQVQTVGQPAEVLVVERLEYGDAIGLPVRIEGPQGVIPAADPRFGPELHRLIAEVSDRRARILTIEKGSIGANSRAIQEHELRIKRATRANDQAAVAASQAEIERLQGIYTGLAKEARDLRRQQNEHRLVLRLADGSERATTLGQIVAAHAPNQLGLFGRLGLTAANLWSFLTENPREANTEGGIFPAIFGTFVMTLLMSLAVTPFGVLAAIYLREYAKQGPFVRAVRIAINNLAGVPSIVFGVFGLGFFVYLAGGTIDQLLFEDRLPTPTYGTGGILWAALTLALMTVPVVIVATEEAIASVPRGAKEGSLALGASKWQTIQRIVLPAAVPGILTGLILAMARGAGEVAPLMLVGVVKLAPSLPVDGLWNSTDLLPFFHMDQKFMHLGFHIYDLGFQSPDSDAAKPMVFATTFFLIVLVLALNLGAILLRERLRRRFATSAF